ncbi:MAG: THUMP domain-containing class I SAM-dependent RNA methyltransferase [Myxococcota bacterium]
MSGGTRYDLFAPVAPGLEALLAGEVAEIVPGARTSQRRGGVSVHVSREDLWRVAASSRLAESLRVRIGHFPVHDFDELLAGLGRLPWDAYVPRGHVPPVKVSTRRSALYHTDAVAERVIATLAARGARAEEVDTPTVHLRIVHDRAHVSVAAADDLHKRGWRPEAGAAPLRETLAAACVRAAGLHRGEQPVWEPFCGAGTMLVEVAAARAGGTSAPPDRGFAFERWPTHDASAWTAVRHTLRAPRPVGEHLGSDRSAGVLAAARRNAERARLDSVCTFVEGDFEQVLGRVPEGAAVLTNVPYGRRLKGGRGLRRSFQRFGDVLARRPDLSPVFVLVGGKDFAKATSLPWDPLLQFSNRGTRVSLLRLRR